MWKMRGDPSSQCGHLPVQAVSNCFNIAEHVGVLVKKRKKDSLLRLRDAFTGLGIRSVRSPQSTALCLGALAHRMIIWAPAHTGHQAAAERVLTLPKSSATDPGLEPDLHLKEITQF